MNASECKIWCKQKALWDLTISLCADSDYITTKFYIFTVSVITVLTIKKTECVGTVRMHLHVKFNVPATNVSIGITIKQKINYIFWANAELLSCILQITLTDITTTPCSISRSHDRRTNNTARTLQFTKAGPLMSIFPFHV